MNEIERIAIWAVTGDVGASSKAMAQKALGINGPYLYTPSDPSDFNRCFKFLEECISDRMALLDKMAMFNDKWLAIRENWDELERFYLLEKDEEIAPKLYEFMRKIGL